MKRQILLNQIKVAKFLSMNNIECKYIFLSFLPA